MTTGIYCLEFSGTDKVYIGQSVNIEKRFIQHKNNFINENASYKLMNAFKLYGLPVLHILEECSKEELDIKEEYYIKEFNSFYKGFNSTKGGSSGTTALQGPEAPNSKFTKQQILDTFNYLVSSLYNYKEISSKTKVSIGVIKEITRGKTHTWLKDEYPEHYAKMIKLKSISNARFRDKKYGRSTNGSQY